MPHTRRLPDCLDSNQASLRMPAPVKSFFELFLLLLQFFERTSPFTPKSGLICSVKLCFDDHRLVCNLSIGFSPTQTSLRSKLRPRLPLQTPFAGSGMPIQSPGVLLPTMPGSELSRVRTELERRRIVTSVPPHPVQANPQPAPHRHLGDAPVSTHRQMYVPTPPVRVEACGRLLGLHQQVAQ